MHFLVCVTSVPDVRAAVLQLNNFMGPFIGIDLESEAKIATCRVMTLSTNKIIAEDTLEGTFASLLGGVSFQVDEVSALSVRA